MLPLSAYALAASRYMHEFGATRRHLAEVAVAARAWAQLESGSLHARSAVSIEQVLAARMVSDPLSVRDCCLVTDGAGAYVLVRADRARDLPNKPVYVLGNGTACLEPAESRRWHNLTVTAATQSGARRPTTWPA
jgi:acetyl-CoA acetyltransferase